MPDLCEDVILNICQYLLPPVRRKKNVPTPTTLDEMFSWSTGQNTEVAQILFNLALINKNWNATCDPLLYRFVSVRRNAARRIDSLLDTCALNPAKAQAIRTIYLRRNRKMHHVPCADDTLAAIELILNRLEISYQLCRRIKVELQAGRPEAKLAALLCMCRNLEEVQVLETCLLRGSLVFDVLAESMRRRDCQLTYASNQPSQEASRWAALNPCQEDEAYGHEQDNGKITEGGCRLPSGPRMPVLPHLQRVRAGLEISSSRRWRPRYEDTFAIAIGACLLVFPVEHASYFVHIMARMPCPDALIYRSLRQHDKEPAPWWPYVANGLLDYCRRVKILTLRDQHWLFFPLIWTRSVFAQMKQLEVLTIDRCILWTKRWQTLKLRQELPTSLRILRIFGREYYQNVHTSEYQDRQLVLLARNSKFSQLVEIQLQLDEFRYMAQARWYAETLAGSEWSVESDNWRLVTLRRKGTTRLHEVTDYQ